MVVVVVVCVCVCVCVFQILYLIIPNRFFKIILNGGSVTESCEELIYLFINLLIYYFLFIFYIINDCLRLVI